ncbi:retrovirus-related pol polyprotein from transposon TNT 1-94 [Tanacetum coccineum]|uniref:Retrovirus-related pol polyprotein from transposon TNT 1-94 n=1 Tax=Tanacetum coccineum TaxID=301880 RepID=A0ABQ5EV70_9ASTR
MPNTRSGASMTHEEIEDLIARRVAKEIKAREAAINLEPLNENMDEQEGGNGGNEGNGNRGNGGNGNEGNGGNGNRENGGNENEENGENGNGNRNRNRNHGMNYGGFMPDSALTWWNSHKRTIGVDAAYAMKWAGLMRLMTKVYCPRNEIQKMETELWNLTVKGNNLTAYTQRRSLKQLDAVIDKGTGTEIVEKVKSRLSKWKSKTLSIGGRLTLLKSVLGSIPVFHMSIFKVPSKVLHILESIRSHFFNGYHPGSKKASWVKWNNVLTDKKRGGLGVSSLFALNRGLMIKWVWKFLSQKDSLWTKVIVAIHGVGGKIHSEWTSTGKSCWLSILSEVRSLQRKGMYVFDYLTHKMGNGESTKFWLDHWHTRGIFKDIFPRLYALESSKDVTVSSKIGDTSLVCSFRRIPRGGIEQNQFDSLVELVRSVTIVPSADRWNWNLESTGIFSVASARRRIDEICLPNIGEETRWVKCVPIKINVLAWKIKTDALPTRFNISRRGIDIQDMSCPICDNAIESTDHLFFRCGLVRDIANKVLSWWNLDHANLNSYAEWKSWLVSIRMDSKLKKMFEGVCTNYMQQLMQNPKDFSDPTTALNMALELMSKAFQLNNITPTNNNQRSSSNPCYSQIAQSGMNIDQDRHMLMVDDNVGNQFRENAVQNVGHLDGQNAHRNGNVVAARAEGNANRNNGNQIRCYNCQGEDHLACNCTVKPGKQDAAYLQKQMQIALKEEAGIQLTQEEFDFMDDAGSYEEIERVNAYCTLKDNLQQASTSGTQTDKAPVYDSDESAELLEPILESHQVPQNDSNVISEASSVEQSGGTVEQYPATPEETRALYDSLYNNLATEVEKVNSVNCKLRETNADLTTELARYKNQEKCFEISQEKYDKLERSFNEKSTVSSLLEEKKRLKSDFKIREDELLDKQIQLENKIKELDNILVKMGQSIQTMHMLSPKPDSFYHTEQKMALGYQNPFYLKQAQQKQQSLYNGKVLLEKHDPPVVYDSEETLELAQESRLKMKQLNKEIKPANYTKINHLSGVFVSQTAKSREELYFSNTSKTANVSKSFSIPNEDFSDDTTPSVARKFLNEQTKFVRDFQSLAKEADESLAKHTALELEIERLLRAVVSQDIMSIVQNNTRLWRHQISQTGFDTLVEECKYDKISYDKAYNDMQQKIERLQAQLGDQKGKSKDTPCVSDTLDPLSQKLENENVELEFQVLNYAKENAHLKTTYKNMFDSIKVTHAQTKAIIDSLQDKLHDTIYENAKLRAQLFDKVFEQKDTNKGTSVNTQFSKQSILRKPPSSSKPKLYSVTPFPKSTVIPKVGKSNALSKPVTSNSAPSSRESTVVNNERVNALIFRINPFKAYRVDNFVPNKHVKASVRTKLITVSQPHVVTKEDYVNGMKSRKTNQSANVSKSANQKKHKPRVWKPKTVGSKERLALPKPSTPRSCLRWSPTGRMFDLKGKIIATSESECQSDCFKGDNACTSNPQEPISKRFPNSTFSMTGGQNWFDTLLIPLLFEYKPKDREDHRDNECDS